MRTIEKKMTTALSFNDDWRCGNTEIRTTEDTQQVFLHGNMIYHFSCGRFCFNNAGRPTRTTISRMNAIADEFHRNIRFYIKGGETCWRLNFEGVWHDIGVFDYLNNEIVNDVITDFREDKLNEGLGDDAEWKVLWA